MAELGKPGDHLANERTFLAWVRTSISIIVFGFVVAKFGITLRQLLRLQGHASTSSGWTLAIGISFMGVGIFMALMALFRYRNTLRRLDSGEFQPARGVIVFLGGITACFGVILAIYVAFTARSL